MYFNSKWITTLGILLLLGGAVSLLALDENLGAVAGKWEMSTAYNGRQVASVMTLSLKDGKLYGVWQSERGESKISDIAFKNGTLSFTRPMGDSGQTLSFEGKVEGNTITGKWTTSSGDVLEVTGKKAVVREGSGM